MTVCIMKRTIGGFLLIAIGIVTHRSSIGCEGWVSKQSIPAISLHRQSFSAISVFQNPSEVSNKPNNADKITLVDRNIYIQELLELARKLGPVGVLRSSEEQKQILDAALNIKEYSDSNSAFIPLNGTHQLIYSAAPGGSSGKIGPFVGKVSQDFIDDKIFVNNVEFGPLKIALTVERKVKNENILDVFFKHTTISLFGQKAIEKEVDGGGSWKYIFSGNIIDKDGQKKLIRIMETPSLFILEQSIS